MPKAKTDPPKYSCGACGMGVKYSAIKCTGPCHLWYHGGCVNVADKHLKKLTEDEVNDWTCGNCLAALKLPTTPDSQGSANQSLINNTKTALTPIINAHITIANNTEELSNILNDPVEELENNTTLTTQDVQLFEDLNPEIFLMEGIETKIQNICDSDLETSISLAAEAGSVLLAENSRQKQDLLKQDDSKKFATGQTNNGLNPAGSTELPNTN
ncbi:hypothetical protein J6590_004895 [Homalodisca vitripennis]|nr:hypothetical protein J6590_004895 [Homalodisca vitripennis]